MTSTKISHAGIYFYNGDFAFLSATVFSEWCGNVYANCMLKSAMAKENLPYIYNWQDSNQPAQLHRLARTITYDKYSYYHAVLAVNNKQVGQSVFSSSMAQINLHNLII